MTTHIDHSKLPACELELANGDLILVDRQDRRLRRWNARDGTITDCDPGEAPVLAGVSSSSSSSSSILPSPSDPLAIISILEFIHGDPHPGSRDHLGGNGHPGSHPRGSGTKMDAPRIDGPSSVVTRRWFKMPGIGITAATLVESDRIRKEWPHGKFEYQTVKDERCYQVAERAIVRSDKGAYQVAVQEGKKRHGDGHRYRECLRQTKQDNGHRITLAYELIDLDFDTLKESEIAIDDLSNTVRSMLVD